MKKYTFLFILVTGLALLSACAETSHASHILAGQPRTPTDPAQVKIYATPPRQYETIAVISADSLGSFHSSAQGKVDAAMERARNEAAALGANGLLFQNVRETGPEVGTAVGVGANSVPAAVGVSSGPLHKQVTLLAIFVTEP